MKTITVPHSLNAVSLLDQGQDVVEASDWQVNDEDFIKLWKLDIFENLNAICGTLIDDHETEKIAGDTCLKQSFEFLKKSITENPNSEGLNILLKAFSLAIQKKTAVYFFF